MPAAKLRRDDPAVADQGASHGAIDLRLHRFDRVLGCDGNGMKPWRPPSFLPHLPFPVEA
jgi:hypothetical protein